VYGRGLILFSDASVSGQAVGRKNSGRFPANLRLPKFSMLIDNLFRNPLINKDLFSNPS
jgi:hypothetical protein